MDFLIVQMFKYYFVSYKVRAVVKTLLTRLASV